jgi:hypothetical protein
MAGSHLFFSLIDVFKYASRAAPCVQAYTDMLGFFLW